MNIAHVYNRTCRRCFLMGDDPLSGKNFDHRKVWIEDTLKQFAGAFGIDLLGFAILSNHFHLILRTRPDVVATWDEEEVARRWLLLCPQRRKSDASACEPNEAEIKSIAGCPVRCEEIRRRLSNISWWMRLLCQRIAMRANREEEETGRFWQDRYRATKLVDEASLLACAAYVDLNPIRAAICQKLEDSDHTSVQRRIEATRETAAVSRDIQDSQRTTFRQPDPFLSPLAIDEALDPIGSCASGSGRRCSDKGFLAMSLENYLLLLDWTARQSASGERGATPRKVAPVLQRIGIASSNWCDLVCEFGKLFCTVAGKPSMVDAMRTPHGHRRLYLRRRARELMSA
ncbi:MAG: transposase [Rhodopirellula sp. JB044]|uniref:transposase n=1 Tax=Rhodopirellula sp. JB044 TaxID=3342844 RepID=UPI00370A7CFF